MDNELEQCQVTCIHEDTVIKVRNSMPVEKVLIDLSELYKVFGDSTRVKILYALSQEELCVCDLANVLGMSQSAVSHQLRLLKRAKLVKNRREGKVVYYSLDDDHVRQIIALGFEHVSERSV